MVDRANAQKLVLHTVDKGPGSQWKMQATSATNLLMFLNQKHGKEIVFVDCQNASENIGRQFAHAFHLHTKDHFDAINIFEKLYKSSKASVENLLRADMVVFYCYQCSARSPAAMKSYLNLSKRLKDAGEKLHAQDVVLLDKGMASFKDLKGAEKFIQRWGVEKSKKLIAVKGDDNDDVYTLYTEED